MFEQALNTRKIILLPAIFAFFVFAIVLFRFVLTPGCYDIRERVPEEGSQGYQTWYGDTIKSFYHHGHKTCVPNGWRAIGATKTGEGWALYEPGKTGIMIRESDFKETPLSFDSSNYAVTLLYPASTSPAILSEYERILTNAFNRIGKTYGDVPSDTPVPHTVLVTADIAGEYPATTLIYPDPRSSVTVVVRDPRDNRSEELVLHAVMHLYNRFSNREAYEDHQSPVPKEAFQELEATWAETALNTSSKERTSRMQYLYSVHTAVMTHNFSLITAPPFNDKSAFESITPRVALPQNASDIDIQYGHYVLSPLVMVAIDGLLYKAGVSADVEDILVRVHTGEADNFFGELARYLADEQLNDIERWLDGSTTIPYSFIEAALTRYNKTK